MAIKLRNIVAELDVNNSKWLRGMDQATNAVQRMERDVTRRFNNIRRGARSLSTLLGGAAVAGLTALVGRYADAADAAGKFAGRIGETVEDLDRLAFIADRSGVGLETLNSSLQRQTNRLGLAAQGNKAYTETLENLGLSVEEITRLSPDEAFYEIGRAISSIENPTLQVTAAQRLWGREGTALLQIVQQQQEELDALNQRYDELGGTISGDSARASAEFNDALTDLSTAFRGLIHDILPYVLPPLRAIVEFATDAVVAFRNLGSAITSAFRSVRDFIFGAAAAAELEELDASAEKTRRTLLALGDQSANTGRSMGKLGRGAKEAGDGITKFNEETGQLIIGITDGDRSLINYIDSLKEQQRQFDLTADKVRALRRWYSELDPTEQMQAWEFFIRELQRFGQVVDNELPGPIEKFSETTQRVLDDVESSFETFWGNMLEGNRSAFESFRDLAVNVLADIIDAYATQRIVAKIETIFGGQEPGDQPGGTGGSAGESQGGIFATITGILGALAGGFVGAGIGYGVGAILGGLLGDDERIKESQLFMGNLRGGLGGPLTSTTPTPFGTDIAFAFRRIGNRGQLGDQEAAEILRGLEDAAEFLAGVDEIIASTLSTIQIGNIGDILAELPSGSRNFDPGNIDIFIRDRYTAVFGAIDESLGAIFEEFSVEYRGDELLNYARDVARIHQALEEGRPIFTDLATTTETLNALMGDFVRNGESLADTLDRINSANGILGALGLDTRTSAGSLFNLRVLEAGGGDVGGLQGMVSNFLGTFFTEEENLLRAQGQLNELVPEMLARLDTTRETFAGDFMGRLQAGALTPEGVIRFLEASEALSALIDLEERLATIRADQATAAITEQVNAINEQIQALSDSSLAIDEQILAQRELQQQISDVSDSIMAGFESTVESIRFSVMDRGEQARFLSLSIESMQASLATITDPARLRATMDEINAQTLRLFNLFDPEEQARISEVLITDLEQSFAAGQERLTQLSEESMAREAQLVEEQNRIEREISEKMAESANVQAQASGTFAGAVTAFQEVFRTPIQVNVSVDTEVDLVGA